MSYGLNKILKKILPRGLFYRSLIIVAAPIIILQLTISIVFFDSIWIKANKGMTESLVGEIKTLFDVYRTNNKEDAILKVKALALRVIADRIEHGEDIPELGEVFAGVA
ncbi:MAG: hypothetical protein HVK32_03190 [Pelagibacteraceae bacterium]|nr:hypothetical protein [Pelagibacteraceae bacterium]MBO6483391.1 hypothetical protein [Pelagibacteraceae bacterium]MBO6484718.1 hypothetical protein [Pelagibacteraceae bacterium]